MINKIKGQNKNKDSSESELNFKKNYIVLLYEFGLKPNEIEALNAHQLAFILSYTSNAINYKVSTIAAGNGLSKKIKFITQGGK